MCVGAEARETFLVFKGQELGLRVIFGVVILFLEKNQIDMTVHSSIIL